MIKHKASSLNFKPSFLNMASMETSVLSFLTSQNRPFSASSVASAIAAEKGNNDDVSKGGVQRALDSLVAKGRVREKVWKLLGYQEHCNQRIFTLGQRQAEGVRRGPDVARVQRPLAAGGAGL